MTSREQFKQLMNVSLVDPEEEMKTKVIQQEITKTDPIITTVKMTITSHKALINRMILMTNGAMPRQISNSISHKIITRIVVGIIILPSSQVPILINAVEKHHHSMISQNETIILAVTIVVIAMVVAFNRAIVAQVTVVITKWLIEVTIIHHQHRGRTQNKNLLNSFLSIGQRPIKKLKMPAKLVGPVVP